MSITPFPSQGQYPWYDQLKNWGADTQTAAENATIAADQAHADAATAQSTADTAVTNAATAQDRADDAFSNAATAQGDATQALADAATADGKAVDAQGDATQALADAATAQSTADTAVTNAATAQDRADNAFTNAATAQSTAEQGVSDASSAQSTADTALTNAATADAKAVAAQGTADQAVLDADAAQTRADNAFSNAATAQSTADTALTNAATAQSTADKALPVFSSPTGADANTLTAPGVYPINYNTYLALNFPVANTYGVLQNLPRIAGSHLVQQYFPVTGVSGGKGFYIRRLTSSVWSNWEFVPTQRIDNTAGRAIYTWDDTQNREQLIYANTGLRDISSVVTNENLTVHTLTLQRYGNLVTLAGRLDGTGVNPGSSFIPSGGIPAGFRYRPSAIDATFAGRTVDGKSVSFITTAGGLGFQLTGYDGVANLLFSVTYMTQDPWPTTLPGTAVGTIPHN